MLRRSFLIEFLRLCFVFKGFLITLIGHVTILKVYFKNWNEKIWYNFKKYKGEFYGLLCKTFEYG